GHLLGQVDATFGDAEQLDELLVGRQPQLEPRCAHAEVPQRLDVHEPRRSGCPSVPSSAMSRRKKRAVVQSATTRSFRVSSGSWYRWYDRVTNQPAKPRKRRSTTSAIPLYRPSVATCPSIL